MAATLISCGAFVPLAVKWPLHTRRVSRITSSIIQSTCLVGKGLLKERCGLEARTNFFSFKKSAKTRCGLDSRIYGIHVSDAVYCAACAQNRGKPLCRTTSQYTVIHTGMYIVIFIAHHSMVPNWKQ